MSTAIRPVVSIALALLLASASGAATPPGSPGAILPRPPSPERHDDILPLLKAKKVEVEARGNGISSVAIRVRRLTAEPLTVHFPAGSYFVCKNPDAQNMVTTRAVDATLHGDGWTSLHAPAACANRPKDVPGHEDTFELGASPEEEAVAAELAKLMPTLNGSTASYPVRQAAVWIVTDDADYGGLGVLVGGFGHAREINHAEAAEAMRLCAEAGLDLREEPIWDDRAEIYWRLEDGPAKHWLETQDESFTAAAKEIDDRMKPPVANLSTAKRAALESKRLSILIGIDSEPDQHARAAWLRSFLAAQGHDVEFGPPMLESENPDDTGNADATESAATDETGETGDASNHRTGAAKGEEADQPMRADEPADPSELFGTRIHAATEYAAVAQTIAELMKPLFELDTVPLAKRPATESADLVIIID